MVATYIISEVRLYRESLATALAAFDRIEIVGAAAHPLDAMVDPMMRRSELVLMDAADHDGPRWTRELQLISPLARFVALALGEGETEVLRWAGAGIVGYVGPDAGIEDLLDTLDGVARGAPSCSARVAHILLQGIATGRAAAAREESTGIQLTPREREILCLIGKGMANAQIARSLFIALPTVKNHVHNILEKLGVSRRSDAVMAIRRAGVFHDGSTAGRLPARQVMATV